MRDNFNRLFSASQRIVILLNLKYRHSLYIILYWDLNRAFPTVIHSTFGKENMFSKIIWIISLVGSYHSKFMDWNKASIYELKRYWQLSRNIWSETLSETFRYSSESSPSITMMVYQFDRNAELRWVLPNTDYISWLK